MTQEKKRAVVLGAGMVGTLMARDLAQNGEFEVTLADRSEVSLKAAMKRMAPGMQVTSEVCDLANADTLHRLAAKHDVLLGALSSHIGYEALRCICETGKPYADISFMEENALDWDALAKEHGATCVVDCGVAPGMSNLLTGAGVAALDVAEEIEIYVGGLPKDRKWPFEYKAGFSPADVIEEYTRPSRIIENGELVVREALSEPEMMEFEGAGALEAFNTDGLRSLVDTLDVPNMKEKTLRYPGHIEIMRIFRETGLFSKQLLNIDGQTISPLAVTQALLFPKWTFEPGEEDFTVMRIIVKGKKAGAALTKQWDLFEPYSQSEQATSMSRTTAIPATLMARALLSGKIPEPGVYAPEQLATIPGLVDEMLEGHATRGIHYRAQ